MTKNGLSNRIVLMGGLLIVCLVAITAASPAADYDREKRWADEVVPDLLVGEPVYLTQKNKHKFLGIYTKAEKKAAALIIVHGMGVHPDWGLIRTLRQRMADIGYTTLSIQMPVLAADASYKKYPALFPDAADRLQVAVLYLRQKGFKKIGIVSHSNGSRMTRHYMLSRKVGVDAWVSLSLTQGDTYKGITIPVLDLYGQKDLEHVLQHSKTRKKTLASNAKSGQVVVDNANHFFNGKEEKVVSTIKNYLERIQL